MKSKSIGQIIRDRRKEKGLKVYELAHKVKVNPVYITQIEKHNKLPSFGIIKRIEEFLDIDIATRYFEEKSPDVAEYLKEQAKKIAAMKEALKMQQEAQLERMKGAKTTKEWLDNEEKLLPDTVKTFQKNYKSTLYGKRKTKRPAS